MKRTFLTLAAIAALAGYLQNSDASPMIGHGPMIRPHPIVMHPKGPETLGPRH